MTEKSSEVYMLAQRVNSLEIGHAKLQTSYEHMANAVEKLADAVRENTKALNIRTGIDKAIMWIAGGGGLAGAVALLKQFLNN